MHSVFILLMYCCPQFKITEQNQVLSEMLKIFKLLFLSLTLISKMYKLFKTIFQGRPPKLTQPPPPRNSNDLTNTTAPPKIAKGRPPLSMRIWYSQNLCYNFP